MPPVNPANRLKPTAIMKAVLKVLRSAESGPDGNRVFLSAYQILERLPTRVRQRLIRERAAGGHAGGSTYSAPRVVSRAAESLHPGVEILYLGTQGVRFEVNQDLLIPGHENCAIFRLKPQTVPPRRRAVNSE